MNSDDEDEKKRKRRKAPKTTDVESIEKILGGLSEREAKVIRMRFGIDLDNDIILGEIGKQFSVTKERIKAIEARALRKLRYGNDDKPDDEPVPA